VTLAVLTLFITGAAAPDLAPATPDAWAAELYAAEAADIDFFSGEVADVSSSSIEVLRNSLGRNDQRRFSINDDTRFEGSAKRGSRVTVGYYSSSPSVAVRVIVRED